MEDAVYQAGIEWLAALLAMQGLEAPVTAQILEDEAGHSCWLTISEENLTPEQVQTLIGEGGEDTIDGLAGDDSIDGEAGSDLLLGGEGE